MKQLSRLSLLLPLFVCGVAHAEGNAATTIGHGDVGRTGDLLLRGAAGVGALTGCCGSDPFYAANLALRAGVRLRSRLLVGLEIGSRWFVGDGRQQDSVVLMAGQYWFWDHAYATIGAGVARVVQNAGNGAGPMFFHDRGAAAALGIGYEIPLHRSVALTVELAESLTRYEEDLYATTSFTVGLTFGARPSAL